MSYRERSKSIYNTVFKQLLILLPFICVNIVHAQQKYSVKSIHSHNDYSRPDPFYHAYKAGVGAIEADIYLRNGKLMVSHDSSEIQPERTLKKMYLDPLKTELSAKPRPVDLVIDLKEGYDKLLPALLNELKPLLPLIKTPDHNAPLTIIITGNRPPPAEYVNYPAYVLFDDDLQLLHNKQQWERVAQVSLNFASYSKWKGEGIIPVRDEKVLRSVINLVHFSGKRLRFWGGPDNPAGWKKLMELEVDILSTDRIDQLSGILADTK